MFLRITRQKDKSGKTVEYLALAVSIRMSDKKHPVSRIVHNFGRGSPETMRILEDIVDSIQAHTSDFETNGPDGAMFLRTKRMKVRNENVECVELVERKSPGKRKSNTEVVHNFGPLKFSTLRTLKRLAESINRYRAKTPEIQGHLAQFKKVEELNLSARSWHCLKNDNILYVDKLVLKSEAELLRIPNFGRTSLEEVKEVLAQMGLHLGMKDAE